MAFPLHDAAPAEIGLSPGGYIARRRAAAGLSIDDVAKIYAHSAIGVPAAAMLLEDAERDEVHLGDDALARLREAFPFERYIYQQLFCGLPTPSLCQDCACSWTDPCSDAGGRPCAWTDRSATLCTSCADKRELAA